MRDNRTILDEAARSIRRTFIGSVAGTITMFAVIGAAGAYGLQDKLTAQGLSGAFASLHAKLTPIIEPAIERARPYFERIRPAQQPEESSPEAPRSEPSARPLRPMPMVMPEPGETVVVPLPPPSAAKPAPVEPVAVVPPVAPVAAPAVAAPVAAEKPPEPRKAEPAPAETKQIEMKAVESPKVEPQAAEVAPAVVAIETPAEPKEVAETAAPVVAAEAPAEPAPPAAPKATMSLAALPGPALPWDLIATPKATLALTDSAVAAPEVETAVRQQATAAAPARPASGIAPMAGRLPPYRTASLGEQPTSNAMSALAKAAPQAEHEAIVNTVTEPRLVFMHLPRPKPPLSPAQRLELTGKDYDKAEKCLAQAIYFEARNEPVRGQQAVAQVVLNRVFSPHYPKDVCSVVFQNAHRHLSCQFTFACDGKPEAIRERGAWARAMRISKQALDAQIWLPDVNKATHYHAAYVRPNWIRDMKVMVRHGLHTFYRPRNWGDGSNEAKWGTPSNSVTSAPVPAKPLTPAQKRFSYHRA